jgi:hypothetical protein
LIEPIGNGVVVAALRRTIGRRQGMRLVKLVFERQNTVGRLRRRGFPRLGLDGCRRFDSLGGAGR